MIMRKEDMRQFFVATCATALMWASIGAAAPFIVMGYPLVAVALLAVALAAWPLRLKFKVRRIKSDNFEDAMREIMEYESRERR